MIWFKPHCAEVKRLREGTAQVVRQAPPRPTPWDD